jgi:diadenosine tetraphosphate (Ap4A) HIT family hydrolase
VTRHTKASRRAAFRRANIVTIPAPTFMRATRKVARAFDRAALRMSRAMQRGAFSWGPVFHAVAHPVPVRPLTVFLPPQPEGTDMAALGETVRRIVEGAPKGGGA